MEIELEYNQPKPLNLSFQLRVREADREDFRKSTGLAEPNLGKANITLQPGDLPNEFFALLQEGVREQPSLTVPFPCAEDHIREALLRTLEADVTGKALFERLRESLEEYRSEFEHEHAAELDELDQAIGQAESPQDPDGAISRMGELNKRLQLLQQRFSEGQRNIIDRFRKELANCDTIQLRTANNTDRLYDLIYRAQIVREHQRLALSEGTGSYGPARLNRLLEAHDRVLRNLREQREQARLEADKAAREQAIEHWIHHHGSQRLKLARDQGYPVDRLYVEERVAIVDPSQLQKTSSPTLEALDLEQKLRERAPTSASLIVQAGSFQQETDAREMVCVSGLFDGCPDLYIEP